MQRRRRWRGWWIGLILVVVVLAATGYVLQPRIMVRISGQVMGAGIHEQGSTDPVAGVIPATVRCNSTTAHTSSDGSYRLDVPIAVQYTCTASAPPNYTPVSYTISVLAGMHITLNFATVTLDTCALPQQPADIECPALHQRTGGLAGTVSFRESGQPAAGVTVRCLSAEIPASLSAESLDSYAATTDSRGNYALSNLPAGPFTCVAGDDYTAHHGAAPPSGRGTLDFQICRRGCATVTPHGGPVIHHMTAYLLYWLPAPYVYDDNVSPATFMALTTRYFKDVGGTTFYNLLGQYWDAQGQVQNSVTVGGTYLDTHAYGRSATQQQPLSDSDIQLEVARVIQAQHWAEDGNHVVFVFTGYGAEVCENAENGICSFTTSGSPQSFICGYHTWTLSSTSALTPMIYAEIVDSSECMGAIYDQPTAGPNGDRMADLAILTAAHEQFEAASDPLGNAWFGDHAQTGEIGDLCENQIGNFGSDGGNITLSHGDRYVVQPMWSNAAGRCVYHP